MLSIHTKGTLCIYYSNLHDFYSPQLQNIGLNQFDRDKFQSNINCEHLKDKLSVSYNQTIPFRICIQIVIREIREVSQTEDTDTDMMFVHVSHVLDFVSQNMCYLKRSRSS